ncbi:MAG: 50S ribosomal protein L31e [Thaumarchaeota archaeon]|nr:50S ribosomal protein L31e [Nitrososphaerota archaeon]
MSEKEAHIYAIPLGRVWNLPPYKRAPKAIRTIREFVQKHLKTKEVKISPEVSEHVWSRGIKKPPRSVKVSVEKDEDGVATVSLAK